MYVHDTTHSTINHKTEDNILVVDVWMVLKWKGRIDMKTLHVCE